MGLRKGLKRLVKRRFGRLTYKRRQPLHEYHYKPHGLNVMWPEQRRLRWQRIFIVDAVCAFLALTIGVMALTDQTTKYAPLLVATSNPVAIVQLIGSVAVSTSLLSVYGTVLSYRLFDRGGELFGGVIGRCARWYAVWALMMSMLLVALSLTSGILAVGLQSSETLLKPAMPYYGMPRLRGSGLFGQLFGSDWVRSIRKAFDAMHSSLHCCGSSTFSEWSEVTWDTSRALTSGAIVGFPGSCCDMNAAVEYVEKLYGGKVKDNGDWLPVTTSIRALLMDAIIQTPTVCFGVCATVRSDINSVECISYTLAGMTSRLQPYTSGCRMQLDKLIKFTLSKLLVGLSVLAVLFTWSSYGFYRTLHSAAKTLQDELDEQREKELEREEKMEDQRAEEIAERQEDEAEREAKIIKAKDEEAKKKMQQMEKKVHELEKTAKGEQEKTVKKMDKKIKADYDERQREWKSMQSEIKKKVYDAAQKQKKVEKEWARQKAEADRRRKLEEKKLAIEQQKKEAEERRRRQQALKFAAALQAAGGNATMAPLQTPTAQTPPPPQPPPPPVSMGPFPPPFPADPYGMPMQYPPPPAPMYGASPYDPFGSGMGYPPPLPPLPGVGGFPPPMFM